MNSPFLISSKHLAEHCWALPSIFTHDLLGSCSRIAMEWEILRRCLGDAWDVLRISLNVFEALGVETSRALFCKQMVCSALNCSFYIFNNETGQYLPKTHQCVLPWKWWSTRLFWSDTLSHGLLNRWTEVSF